MTEWLAVDDPDTPNRAADVIQAGGIIILPTDTVYGVAAGVWQPEAVAALYATKQRPPDRAIPILVADADDMVKVASDVPKIARQLAAEFWPGPLTIAVPKCPTIPEIVSSLPTVGLRIPDHAATRAVIRACGGVLAVTSANLSGKASPLKAKEATILGEGVALILDGGMCPGGVPSTVVDVTGGELRIVRPGPLDEETLWQAIGGQ